MNKNKRHIIMTYLDRSYTFTSVVKALTVLLDGRPTKGESNYLSKKLRKNEGIKISYMNTKFTRVPHNAIEL